LLANPMKANGNTSELRRLRKCPDGRLTYSDSNSTAGLVLLCIGVLATAIGLMALRSWIGATPLREYRFHAFDDAPVLVIPTLGFFLTIFAAIVTFRRGQLIFDPSNQEVQIVKSGLGWRENAAFRYDQIHAEMRALTIRNYGKYGGLDWHGYALKLLWPGGAITLCSSAGISKTSGLDRVRDSSLAFGELTGIQCAILPNDEWPNSDI